MESYLMGLLQHAGPLCVIFSAAFLQAVTGFGIVIVSAPLLMFFYEPKMVVPIMLMIASCGNFTQGLMNFKKANLPLVGRLFLGAVISQPLGFFVFNHVESDVLKLYINAFLLFALAAMQITHRRIRECGRNSVITGMASGFTSITTGMSGPPFLIYLAYTDMAPAMFRATCFVFFCTSNLLSLSAYVIGGHDLTPAAREFIYLVPALALGIFVGNRLFKYMSAKLFKKIIFVILYLVCAYNIVSVWMK
ncbi:hypothetical protein TAMA11512_00220 [Selenomonas sp. TAMA-11512]|uniref:sulfite exporter TauE/SafE family protein n=1 Tax=Selenomonas sp. TAMA-11512 TaxID=3095337 RepID=UPI003086E281|nr:hypothetical protein TAMA11512_00220 [Selenomonas sp. TAMA-11512]